MKTIRIIKIKDSLMSSICSSDFQCTYSLFDMVSYVTGCYRRASGLQRANISYLKQLELLFK